MTFRFDQKVQDDATKQAAKDLESIRQTSTAAQALMFYYLADWMAYHLVKAGPKRLARLLVSYSNKNPYGRIK